MNGRNSEPPRKKRFKRTRKAVINLLPWTGPDVLNSVGSSYNYAQTALRRRQAPCPNCKSGRLMVKDAIHHEDTTSSTPLLVCDSCEYSQNISLELENVAERIADLRVGERRFLIAALGSFALGLAYLLVAGNLFTMIGATLIAVLLFANALVFRYRVWQLSFKRLYETRPPFSDWLRYELFSSKEDLP